MRTRVALAVLLVLAIVGTGACLFAAIWVHGPDAERWFGTACLLALAAGVILAPLAYLACSGAGLSNPSREGQADE